MRPKDLKIVFFNSSKIHGLCVCKLQLNALMIITEYAIYYKISTYKILKVVVSLTSDVNGFGNQ